MQVKSQNTNNEQKLTRYEITMCYWRIIHENSQSAENIAVSISVNSKTVGNCLFMVKQ